MREQGGKLLCLCRLLDQIKVVPEMLTLRTHCSQITINKVGMKPRNNGLQIRHAKNGNEGEAKSCANGRRACEPERNSCSKGGGNTHQALWRWALTRLIGTRSNHFLLKGAKQGRYGVNDDMVRAEISIGIIIPT
jgi:hypothetical protein